MNCEHCQESFLARERGELEPEVLRAVAAHVRGCATCARAEATLHEFNTLLDAEVAPSPGLRGQVLAHLEQEAAQRKAPVASGFTSVWFASVWPSRPLGAFSYSLALVLCGVFGGQLLPLGTGANVADIPAERLYQLCAVPAPPARDIL
jgi:hypothetical protein